MPSLNWIGKPAVVAHHKQVPFRLLKCRADLSVGDAQAGNLLVQGDNLEALKALLPYYAGRFYPDFVCKLHNGRSLVVEYKGGHLYTDAEEKRIIGELWEKRSQGRCLFVMPTERKFELVQAKVRNV
jgi:hypothetical protein